MVALSRPELSEFLPTPRAVRVFEQLQTTTEQNTTNITNVENVANDSMSLSLSNEAQMMALLNQIGHGPLEQDQSAILSALAALEQAPPDVSANPTRYGYFVDSTTQTAAVINTAYPVTFNTSANALGVTIGTPASRIYVDRPGVYSAQFSLNVEETSGGSSLAWAWLRVNGSDVTGSAQKINIRANATAILFGGRRLLQLADGDYIEAVWATDNTGVQLNADAATAFAPAVSSATLSLIDNISSTGI